MTDSIPSLPLSARPNPDSEPLPDPPLHKTKSWQHQIKAYHHAMGRRGSMLPLKMGRGKSLVAINVAANMGAKKTLIIGPARALGVWPREFELHSPIPFRVVVLNKGSTKDKVRIMNDAMALASARGEPIVIVANYETAIRAEFQQFVLSKLWDLIVADEIHRAKDPTGATGKFFGKLGFVGKKKLGLTGTPLPHDLLDAFSQYRFLDPSVFGMQYVPHRQRYAKMHEIFSGKVTQWLNEEEFKEKFWSIAYYDDGTGGAEMPEYTDQIVPVELTPRGRAVYDEMEEQLIVEVESGVVTAANALVRLIRLQQILSGFVMTEDGKIEEVDNAKERALVGMLEDIAPHDPVVVFTWFKHDLVVIRRIAEEFGRKYGEISGDRSDLTEHAKMPEWCDLMGVQIQSGGTGIDLTRAMYGIYYSASFNNGLMEQSFYRLYRPGQKRTCNFYRLVAENTVDRAIYGTLAKRQDLVAGVMDYLKMRGQPVLG